MLNHIDRMKVVDVELSTPPQPLKDLDGYQGLKALVRLHGIPIGYVEIPLLDNGFTATDLRKVILRRLARSVIRHHLRDLVENPLPPGGLSSEELLELPHPAPSTRQPLITVAVCTRDRAEDLRLCLDSLGRLDYPNLDIVVIDNAPTSETTMHLVNDHYPQVRYICEPRPGLDWARNRAIVEARGEVVAYTDDDVVVDPGWVTALAAAFEDPQVMAVTGLVAPYELETEAQILFERYGGFGKGFRRKYWQIDREGGERPYRYLGAGEYGTGANMAFRHSLFDQIGFFDPALDVGTVTNGGGDLEIFFRTLKEGYLLVYEPAAVVHHRHRRDRAALRVQLANNGVGMSSYLVRTALMYPEARRDVVKLWLWWFSRWVVRRVVASYAIPSRFPRDQVWAELRGSLIGLGRYPKAQRSAARIASADDRASNLPHTSTPTQKPVVSKKATVGVRTVDLCEPLQGLDDVSDHAEVRVYAHLRDQLIGEVQIDNKHQPVSAARLREYIVNYVGLGLLGQNLERSPDANWDSAAAAVRRYYLPTVNETAWTSKRLPDDVPVSIVLATYDRPDDLRNCLRCLTAQETARPVEILVVDNHPVSGLTPPVVAEFPGVTLVTEKRQGLSYARNKGITASRGKIIVTADDDVSMPSDWLEKLVAPFVQSNVGAVTGDTLPLMLETTAQRLFESYGGLGRGFAPREVDGEWYKSFWRRAVPTWELGATANAAFRASLFAHPEIGLMDEALGAGTPTGCSEDTYLFYKILKSGYTILYEPSAYVWHKHRREMRALCNQLYNYGKGHVAYHLMTLLRDRDRRAIAQLLVRLPMSYRWRLASALKRHLFLSSDYPLQLILLEIRGNLAGPWSLWRSYRRVKREGRSDPYVPVSQRGVLEGRPQVVNPNS